MSEQPAVTMEQVVEALQRANVVATAQGESLSALEEQRNAFSRSTAKGKHCLG